MREVGWIKRYKLGCLPLFGAKAGLERECSVAEGILAWPLLENNRIATPQCCSITYRSDSDHERSPAGQGMEGVPKLPPAPALPWMGLKSAAISAVPEFRNVAAQRRSWMVAFIQTHSLPLGQMQPSLSRQF